MALTIGVYAVRALFVTTWVGGIPGSSLLWMLLVAILMALAALVMPGRVRPFREAEGGWWRELSDDWRHHWRRWSGRSS